MSKRRNKDEINFRLLPSSVARLLNGVRIALGSTINGNVLSKETGISHSEIYRLRSGKRKVSHLSLRSCVLLASYPDYKVRDKYSKLIINEVYNALNCGISIHQIALRSHVPENTLYKLNQVDKSKKSGHIFDVNNISILTLAKVIHYYEYAKKNNLLHTHKEANSIK